MTTAVATENRTRAKDAMNRVLTRAEEIRAGRVMVEERVVAPGAPARITEAFRDGEAIAQGDMTIEVQSVRPADFVLVEKRVEADRQLVPGNNIGARHCLSTLEGVELYRAPSWPNVDNLIGPWFISAHPIVIEHPKHGHVHIPANTGIQISYAREFDQEEKKNRRARD